MQTHLSLPTEPISSPAEIAIARAHAQRPHYTWLALLVAGPVLLLVLKLMPALDRQIIHDPLWHVLITSVAALIGIVLAALMLRVAYRASDGRVFFIGMGVLSIASILATHSISTPDVLMQGRGLATALSAVICLFVGSVFFAASSQPIAPALNAWLMRHARVWTIIFILGLVAFNWVLLNALAAPATTPAATSATMPTGYHDEHADSPPMDAVLPEPGPVFLSPAQASSLRTIVVIIGLGLYGLAITRHYALYRRSPSPAGLGVICGMTFFGEALFTQYLSQSFAVSFWLHHAQEFTGFAIIAYAILGMNRNGATNETMLESLLLSGTRARLQAGYAHAMEQLVETLSRGEQPTPALRDALRARFGMAESQLRVIEAAAGAVAQERAQRQQLEQMNQSLQQLEAHKSQLTQLIVHDLKNPLTALIGFLDLLKLDRLTEDQLYLLSNAARSSRRLSDLIGDLLDLDRIEEGRLELDRRLVVVPNLLQECADEMQGWLLQDNKTIAIELPADLPPLYADPRLLRRVLINLISNAIKHTPSGTHIILYAAYRSTHLNGSATYSQPPAAQFLLDVSDNGPGIAQEHLEQIFEKFGRVASEQTSRQNSTGLGLTLCRLVAEAHGGTIDVSSTVGVGTTFRLMLPEVVPEADYII